MTPSERNFCRQIEREPKQIEHYQVFADWLQAQGDLRGPPLAGLTGVPTISRHEDVFFATWKDLGISLRFDSLDYTLAKVFLFAQDADGHQMYRGPLPYDLSLTNTREQVEAKLGKPDKTGGDGVIPYWVNFNAAKIHVTYERKAIGDMQNPIHHIGIGN